MEGGVGEARRAAAGGGEGETQQKPPNQTGVRRRRGCMCPMRRGEDDEGEEDEGETRLGRV